MRTRSTELVRNHERETMTLTVSRLAGRPQILARTSTTGSDNAGPAAGGWSGATSGRQTPAARRIGLIGLFGLGNAGNDGSLEAMLLFLRQVRPDAELTCFCACNPGPPERSHAISTFRRRPSPYQDRRGHCCAS